MRSDPLNRQVAIIRGFNRFYTRLLGLLDGDLLRSGFSLGEVRILYELAHRTGLTAADLVRDLRVDGGYLSRTLKRLEGGGLIARKASPTDARQSVLTLTEAGDASFRPIEHASNSQIAALVRPIGAADRDRLVNAMTQVQRLLGGLPEPPAPYVIRPPRPGDLGWVVHRQGILYAQEYGWDETYEALVAEIGGHFFKAHDPRRERCWIVERHGEVAGSVFLVREGDTLARLRLLYVEPGARGLGIGARLVDECIGWARRVGYSAVTLWTNDILVSARRIYEAAGFRLVSEDRHRSFGKDLVGQTWMLTL